MNTETMKQVYLLAQEHCGLKVGDWVRVTRKAENYESGWAYEWLSDAEKTIGKIGKICDIRPVGIEVSFIDQELANCWYPYFVLEKVEKPAHELKPFDKVLVRDSPSMSWHPDIYLYETDLILSFGVENTHVYKCCGGKWFYCIPYEGNEHLVGTTDDPE